MTLPLLRPMLSVNAQPFSDPAYLFEVKWDGYRCLAYLEENRTLLRSRNLRNLTPAFPELETLHLQVEALPAILDGEIIIFTDGRPDFGALQARGRLFDQRQVSAVARSNPAVFVAFDLLYLNGSPVLKERLERRRELLKEAVRASPEMVVSDFITGEGEVFLPLAQRAVWRGLWPKSGTAPTFPASGPRFGKKSGLGKARTWLSAAGKREAAPVAWVH